jgi:predicted phosphodiesterase
VRYLIISDVHANWEGLQAVLADAEGKYDKLVNCGDLVGYGPDPNAVLDWCRTIKAATVRGNHDKACAHLENLDWFNPVARTSAEWTSQMLTPENRQYLVELPKGPAMVDNFLLFHGAPQDEDEYIVNDTEAADASMHIDTQLSFFGHSHLQGAFAVHRNGILTPSEEFVLEETMKYLVNPGSVGQPRDGDPRAAYALYDSDERLVQCRRVDYDHVSTWRKILIAGLPEVLGRRLFVGV